MKKTKIVVPALAVLLLSTAASVTGTVAWFSMNSSVTVTGMTVTTKVSSNLLIAEHNHENEYSDSIEQTRSGILEPASTVDGKVFFYTTKAKGDGTATDGANGGNTYVAYDEANGTALENTYANKAKYDASFNGAYGFSSPAVRASANDEDNVGYAYIDYSFYVKATSAADDQVLYMSKCNLLYGNSTDGYAAITSNNTGGFAWRVALLAADSAKETNTPDTELATKSIIGLSGKLNQNQVNLVSTSTFTASTDVSSYYTDIYGTQHADGNYVAGTKYYNTPTATPNAVKTVSTLGTITNVDNAAQARTDIDTGITAYTKIVVRLWLEGEDVSCTSTTYASLTKSWKLDLEFKLGNANDGATPTPNPNGVKVIGSVAA